MAMVSYLTLKSKDGVNYDGDCTQAGHEKTIVVYEVDHKIEIPRDMLRGTATGQRVHSPLVITKTIDCASPLLQMACCSGKQFEWVMLEFWRIDETGHEEHFYTIRLEDAIIVQTRNFKPMTLNPESNRLDDMEQIFFTYEKIVWTYEPEGITEEDDWNAPKSG